MSIGKQIGWRGEALGWDGYQSAFRAMGLEGGSDRGAAIAKAIGPRLTQHHIARVNMQIAFPDAAPREIDRLREAMWENLGRTLGEFPNVHRLDLKNGDERLTIKGREIVDDLVARGRRGIFIGAHFGNWEVMAAVAANAVERCLFAYRRTNNPKIDRRIIAQRNRNGMTEFAPKGSEGGKALMKALKDGSWAAMLVDQKMNDGIEAPLFGRPAMSASAHARMAVRYDAPIVPVSVVRRGGARFTVEFHEPVPVPATEYRHRQTLELVTATNRFVQERIYANPEQWFWVHRRFEKPLYRRDES
jgi:Kdo2-lipid IVA lauroyltransferase/acyltransferase